MEKNRFCFENTAPTFIILNNIDIVDFGKDLNANIVFFWQNLKQKLISATLRKSLHQISIAVYLILEGASKKSRLAF